MPRPTHFLSVLSVLSSPPVIDNLNPLLLPAPTPCHLTLPSLRRLFPPPPPLRRPPCRIKNSPHPLPLHFFQNTFFPSVSFTSCTPSFIFSPPQTPLSVQLLTLLTVPSLPSPTHPSDMLCTTSSLSEFDLWHSSPMPQTSQASQDPTFPRLARRPAALYDNSWPSLPWTPMSTQLAT